ncbi:PREDICTED: uncharacterized protein At4g30180-like [Tarenaya hassleriana]|uniref:uncharacterized protein At4g30180-like n=1 Tax=Tarenaya hassleriana TaxID=28532 RepID=UPI00053C9932|nr:PREDICTED: uncharacterized protein At4g30180-like [Tarenaya hassleriana]
MERKINERKRVFSLHPNRNPTAAFTRKYANCLVPALKKMAMNKPSSGDNGLRHKIGQNVKHEVDAALDLPAQEFAWTRFLRRKLSFPDHTTRSFWSPEQTLGDAETKLLESSEKRGGEEEEEEEIRKRVEELKRLLPGGEEMGVEETLSEIGSYILRLELQILVLKSLVDDI